MTPDKELRKRNLRLGLTLAALALAFFLAIVVRRYWFVHG